MPACNNCVQIANNAPLLPGHIYDIYATVGGGADARVFTKEQIQNNIGNSKLAGRVKVVDFVATAKNKLALRIQILPASATDDIAPQQVLAIIIAATVLGAGFFFWQSSIHADSVFEHLDNIISNFSKDVQSAGGQIFTGAMGIGLAALGLAALVYFTRSRRRKA